MSVFRLTNGTTVNVNLTGTDYAKLKSGEWKIGWIADNAGINDESNDTFYETRKKEGYDGETAIRCFKNKVPLKTEDGKTCLAHIIHWVPGKTEGSAPGFFCATSSSWDPSQQ